LASNLTGSPITTASFGGDRADSELVLMSFPIGFFATEKENQTHLAPSLLAYLDQEDFFWERNTLRGEAEAAEAAAGTEDGTEWIDGCEVFGWCETWRIRCLQRIRCASVTEVGQG